MHAAAPPDEVRLRKGSSLSERLVWAGSGGAVLLIVVPGLVTWASGGPPLAAAFWAVPLGVFLIGVAAFESNVVWIVTSDGIAIGEQRPMGQVRKQLIGIHDIADVSVCKSRFSYPKSFSLRCTLGSGDVLVSRRYPISRASTKPPRWLCGCSIFPIPHWSTIRSMPPTPRSFFARRSV